MLENYECSKHLYVAGCNSLQNYCNIIRNDHLTLMRSMSYLILRQRLLVETG